MFRHILVPTDGSMLSNIAVRQAAQLAAETAAKLTVVYVKPPYPDVRYGESGVIAPITPARFREFEEKEAQRILGLARNLCMEAGVACTALSAEGDEPSRTLLQTARNHDVDLICMASHGRRGLRRLLMGSETHKVLTHSAIPVLVLRSNVC
ncbi:universal stress protein [Pseudothauera nasutitermitis]|uniref:Universal stress protein n=1 Tax=Pseudothauera nasutitermitis TaxID=2565930 RepID=A0A4S4AUR0_9RHOO|nr:universal stress protein [Pseudothauera nasutitermitis]THF63676.1 universal stress protein [Pseudothauera nasutitermitis]